MKNSHGNGLMIASSILKYGLILLFIFITILPFLWALSTSLRPLSEILSTPPRLLPSAYTLKNYLTVLLAPGFPQYMFNSIIVSGLSVCISVLASMLAGYAASRYSFKGKNLVLFLILAGMAIGRFTNAIPLYFFSIRMGLFDTIFILVVSYAAFITPLITWLMQSYFDTIPRSLEEAAKIDGCNPWMAFWRVVVPAMKPAIVAGSIISLTYAWNEFILALVLTKNMRTLPVSLYFFITDMGVDWGSLTAASFILIIPILAVFLLLQKYFLQGLTAGTLGGT
jgi:ABC-type glycerol-3-phosphate transport system permease component